MNLDVESETKAERQNFDRSQCTLPWSLEETLGHCAELSGTPSTERPTASLGPDGGRVGEGHRLPTGQQASRTWLLRVEDLHVLL